MLVCRVNKERHKFPVMHELQGKCASLAENLDSVETRNYRQCIHIMEMIPYSNMNIDITFYKILPLQIVKGTRISQKGVNAPPPYPPKKNLECVRDFGMLQTPCKCST